MSRVNKEIKAIKNDLSMNSKEKKEEIEKLQSIRTDIARYYLGKDLIKEENKEQIELYEYYPASDEYTYSPDKNTKVKVQYTEIDKRKYAELCKKYYEDSLEDEEKKASYKKMTEEEKEDKRKSLLTSARNKAKNEVSKIVYERK